MKRLFTYLFYASLIFLGFYLYKADYLSVPKIISGQYLGISIALLFTGFFVQNFNWRNVLRIFKLHVSLPDTIRSVSLTIFMKYIPGKVMVMLGRAAYISSRYNASLEYASTASIFSQIIGLWVGFLLGSIVLFNAEIAISWQIISFIIFLGLSVALIFPGLLKIVFNLFFRILKRRVEYPRLRHRDMLAALPPFIITWLCWGFGFYFLTLSMVDLEIPLAFGFAFPLAGALSIVSLFAPGGLGIREGLLVSSMLIYDIPLGDATTIALASRLWFLLGESTFFGLGLLLQLLENKKPEAS